MTAFRLLQLVIACAILLDIVKAEQEEPPMRFEDLKVELCDLPCANNGKCIAFDSVGDGFMDPQCFCNATFQGDLCETPRPCSLACENGGTCSLGDAWWFRFLSYDDVDEEGLLDFFFEMIPEECSSVDDKDCKNTFGSSERCECPRDTRGKLCEIKCEKTCLNGAECTFRGSEQHCSCTENFYGDQCENKCTKGCQNGGICIPNSDGSGGLEELCLCPAGFEGELCETETPCPMTCQNEGVCKIYGDQEFNYDYIQYILERCTARGAPISECFGIDGEPKAYCECPTGTQGKTCEFTCDLDCQNGFPCRFSGFQDTYCPCDEGFVGDLCQFQCSKNCVNGGVCTSDGTNESCQCSPYYEGDLCETERACDLTCLNGGYCVMNDRYRKYNAKYFENCLVNNFVDCPGIEDIMRCSCTSGFIGRDCDTPCPCQNGGTCSDDDFFLPEEEHAEEDGGYFCRCPFGYYGRDCEFKYDSEDCALDCQNGGYCIAGGGYGDYDIGEWEHEHEHEHEEIENDYNYGKDKDAPRNTIGAPPADSVAQRPEFCVCPRGFMGLSCEIEIDACENRCTNGGVCTTADFVSTQGGNRALEDAGTPSKRPICSCPEGYSGNFCQHKACGSGHCSHGGTCIELPSGQITSAGDDYVCDCSTSALEDTVGIGRNCDAIVYSTCPWVNSKKNPNEPWTCAGYGRCYNEEGSTTPKCYCGDRVSTGPRCEFDSTDPKDVAWSECSLQCSNDGICLKGATKPVAEIFIPFVEGTKKSGLFDYQTPDFEYCYCPEGFFGVQCDLQYDICGNKDHICFHGSTCTNNGGEWGCDCAGTESAGLYCQYKATDNCGDSDAETFCTNGSTCTLDSNSNAVCACQEGWEGTKCETEIKLAAPAGGGDNNWSSATVAGALVSISSLAMVSLALIVA